MTDYIQVITTVERREDAEAIARALVQERLAACVQIVGPVTSIYRWQGNIETALEFQCWAKTRHDFFDRVAAAIRRMHTYQVPEIIAVPISAGGADYLAWLDGEVSD
jgi:periplasmic divalent cation tolerance protein